MSNSLYSRLDGYDAIATFVTKLVAQAQQHELLGRFWQNRAKDRIDSELQLLINYLVRETGGQMFWISSLPLVVMTHGLFGVVQFALCSPSASD